MKKLLIALFFMLILGFSFIGVTNSPIDIEENVDHDDQSAIIESY
ncbi:hypothetical protein ACFQ3N_00880 [Virgibacillus byunsanensis]|uniref:Aspartate phosphatase n=1 Tax=Virgibacillus byunsanensis TaxID=570945 RepID=A0ABW3LF10_9BACI